MKIVTRSILKDAMKAIKFMIGTKADKDYVDTKADKKYVEEQIAARPIVNPDWNQNDPSKPDYIKNRACYDDSVTEVFYPRETITVSEGDYYIANANFTTEFVAGETYRVLFNGKTYDEVAQDDKSPTYIGDYYSEDPFWIYVRSDGLRIKTTNGGSGLQGTKTFDFEILHVMSGSLKQLDKKFIPPIELEDLPELPPPPEPHIPTPDWDANNSYTDGYIANKPFGYLGGKNFVTNISNITYKYTPLNMTVYLNTLYEVIINYNYSEKETFFINPIEHKLDDSSIAYSLCGVYKGAFFHINYNKNTSKAGLAIDEEIIESKIIKSIEIYSFYNHDAIKKMEKSFIKNIDGVGKKYFKFYGNGNAGYGEIFNDYMNNKAGSYSHAEGRNTTASGDQSHAEGSYTTASGNQSHAEGVGTTASGYWGSHAEGSGTTACNFQSHAEGNRTTASGNCAHAEGSYTTASGDQSHAEGASTTASSENQHVQGKLNIDDPSSKYAHIVGNGTSSSAHSNAHTLDWDGNSWYQGSVLVGGKDMDAPDAELRSDSVIIKSSTPSSVKRFKITVTDDGVIRATAI